jgi:hypothetical protein
MSSTPKGLSQGCAFDRLLGSQVRIPPAAWMSVSCECCVLSGRGLCDRPIPRPEESTDCGVSLCLIQKPQERRGPGTRWAVAPERKTVYLPNFS